MYSLSSCVSFVLVLVCFFVVFYFIELLARDRKTMGDWRAKQPCCSCCQLLVQFCCKPQVFIERQLRWDLHLLP